jgi:hypothetical protein
LRRYACGGGPRSAVHYLGSSAERPEGRFSEHRPSSAAIRAPASLAEFETYIGNHQEYIPNYGELYRQGETISTAFVESTINQVVSRRFVKEQQMQWTLRGAHLLLQTRTKVLNDELDDVFRRWYARFRPQPQTTAPERKVA